MPKFSLAGTEAGRRLRGKYALGSVIGAAFASATGGTYAASPVRALMPDGLRAAGRTGSARASVAEPISAKPPSSKYAICLSRSRQDGLPRITPIKRRPFRSAEAARLRLEP